MTDPQKLREEYKLKGFLLPEWLIRLEPYLEGEMFVVVDEVKGKVYFPAEQFTIAEVQKRYELITRFSN